jgi:hypothetical protein
MSETLSSTDVASILSQWKAGLLTNAQVHDWATARYAVDAWEPEDGAVNEVLARLDMMDMNLVTVEDAGVLLAALGKGTAEGAAQAMDAYQDTLDFAARKLRLADDPLYARSCI